MAAVDHDRVMEVLGEALDLPEDQRGTFIEQACQGDDQLKREVNRLLTGASSAAGAIPTAPIADMSEVARFHAHPTQIGPYRIIRQLGEGGMGIVYLAEQERPVQRVVALKLIRPGMDSREVLHRFDAERQALAVITHPNVARVFDAGTTDGGRPYFVMEFVPGDSIGAFCDLHLLNITDRLRLFIQVCDAIQHAHQKGIIHRDLKGSNVLVAMEDGKPVPKVIDFGVARATKRELRASTLFTEAGQLIGTPEYMSPEQAAMGAMDVDTRTDIYALGVILYELLAGSLPFDHTMLREAGFDELRRIIREVDPPRPSTRLLRKDVAAERAARNRRSDRTSLSRSLRDDLDWIAMKAMEKDRDRRYQSVADLIADIRRFLNNEPVLAGPPSTLYRVRKFVRRHRLPVAAAAVVLITLLGGMIGTTLQWYRALKAERETHALFSDVRRLVSRMMSDVHAAIAYLPGATPARRLLVQTGTEYLDKLASIDRDDLPLQNELARAYMEVGDLQGMPTQPNLGDYNGALATYRKSVDISRRVVAVRPDDPVFRNTLARGLNGTAALLHSLGKYEESIVFSKEAVAVATRLYTEFPDDPDIQKSMARTLNTQASTLPYQNHTGKLELHRKALAIFEDALKRDPSNVNSRRSTAITQSLIADECKALRLYQESLDAYEYGRKLYVEMLKTDPNNAYSLRALASTLHQMGDLKSDFGNYSEALPDLRAAVEIFDRLLKADPENSQARMDYSTTTFYLANVEYQADEFDNAIATMRDKFLPYVMSRYPPDSARVLNYRLNYATMLMEGKRFADSEATLKDILQLATNSREGEVRFKALRSLGVLYGMWNKPELQQEYVELAAEAQATTRPQADPMVRDHGSTPAAK